jgi:hypothetical protein
MKIGDVLTTATIVVSVVALLISWSKDRYSRQKEQADRVRGAVAVALAKLDRWQVLQLSLFQDLQPVFIDTSEMLAKDFNFVEARDFLWRSINAQRTNVADKVLNEQIESAYVGLFSHFPKIRPLFLETISDLNDLQKTLFNAFLVDTQLNVLSFDNHRAEYASAKLGNALRETATKYEEQLKQQTDLRLEQIRLFLFQVVSQPDRTILTEGLEQRR